MWVLHIYADRNSYQNIGSKGRRPNDELALDRYEGYPSLYRKEEIAVTVQGRQLTAMVYIMNNDSPQIPNKNYYRTIEEGYDDI